MIYIPNSLYIIMLRVYINSRIPGNQNIEKNAKIYISILQKAEIILMLFFSDI